MTKVWTIGRPDVCTSVSPYRIGIFHMTSPGGVQVEPKYFRLAADIRAKIQQREYPPGSRLPSEDELTVAYHCSRGTIRQALDTLERAGLIRRDHGRGTFVNELEPALESRLFGLTSVEQELAQKGRAPSTKLLKAELRHASRPVARMLGVAPRAEIVYMAQLFMADGLPVALEERHIDHTLCPGILDDILRQASLTDIIRHKYGLPILKLTHSIERIMPTAEEAALLDCATGDPLVFEVNRLSHTAGNSPTAYYKPIVWIRALHREDTYDMHIQPFRSLLAPPGR